MGIVNPAIPDMVLSMAGAMAGAEVSEEVLGQASRGVEARVEALAGEGPMADGTDRLMALAIPALIA